MIQIGEILRIKGYKRMVAKVTEVKRTDSDITYSIKSAYKPSPRSRLKNKSVFSKFKNEIIK